MSEYEGIEGLLAAVNGEGVLLSNREFLEREMLRLGYAAIFRVDEEIAIGFYDQDQTALSPGSIFIQAYWIIKPDTYAVRFQEGESGTFTKEGLTTMFPSGLSPDDFKGIESITLLLGSWVRSVGDT